MTPPEPQTRARWIDTLDGGRVAYRCEGQGPDLVFTSGLSANDFYWREVMSRLPEGGRSTIWDLPGHGESEPARHPEELTVEQCADDLRRVLDGVGAKRATLLGFSLGCQIVLEAWRHFPERIEAMVLVLGPYGRPFDEVLHPRVGPLIVEVIARIHPRALTPMLRGSSRAARLPGAFALSRALGVVGPGATPAMMRPYFDHLGDLDGPTWAGLALAAQRHSAEDLLESITVPVLIVSGGRDVFTPTAASERMEGAIPSARRVHLPQAAHTGIVEEPERVTGAIRSFLAEHDLLRLHETGQS